MNNTAEDELCWPRNPIEIEMNIYPEHFIITGLKDENVHMNNNCSPFDESSFSHSSATCMDDYNLQMDTSTITKSHPAYTFSNEMPAQVSKACVTPQDWFYHHFIPPNLDHNENRVTRLTPEPSYDDNYTPYPFLSSDNNSVRGSKKYLLNSLKEAPHLNHRKKSKLTVKKNQRYNLFLILCYRHLPWRIMIQISYSLSILNYHTTITLKQAQEKKIIYHHCHLSRMINHLKRKHILTGNTKDPFKKCKVK